MTSHSTVWLAAFIAVFQREVLGIARNAQLVVFCFIAPTLWLLAVWALLGQGVMTRAPAAFIDNDNTPLSRETARAIASCRSVELISYNQPSSALSAMRQGKVYGVILIPAGYERDKLTGRGSSVIFWTDENRYAVATMQRTAVAQALAALENQRLEQTALRTGASPVEVRRLLNIVHSDFYALGNAEGSFLAFLGSNLLPSLIMIGAMFSFATAFLRELWHDSTGQWLACAGNRFFAAVCGKLTPWFAVYVLIFIFYMALFGGEGGFNITGSTFVWLMLGLACLADFAAAAIVVVAISPTWRMALVACAGFAAPALPFTGFSMPIDSMSRAADIFSHCLPLTWYIQGQAQVWTLGASPASMGNTFAGQAAIFIILLCVGLPLLRLACNRKIRLEAVNGQT